jgi:hypothetical protein
LRRIFSDIEARNAKPVYYAHRDDGPEKLHRIKDDLGVEIRRPDTPIELEFITNNQPLASVAGFYSTALFSLRALFPDVPVTAYRIPERKIDTKYRAATTEFYQPLKEAGITVVPDS